MSLSATPVPSKDRAVVLDVLRGFALLGIFFNNIYGFSGYGFLSDEQARLFSTYQSDQILNFVQIALVEGKFYSLFSLLFGIGFSVLLLNGQSKRVTSLRFFYRRLLILLVIGALHLYFLWPGDILLLYAFLGFFLPIFRNSTDKTLLAFSFVLILSPIAIDILKISLQWSPADFIRTIGEPIDTRNGLTEENWRSFLFNNENGLTNWRAWQESGWLHRFHYLLDTNRLPKVFGLFLLGFFCGRKMMHSRLEENRGLLKRLMLLGFTLGIPFNVAMAFFELDEHYVYASVWGLADTVTYALGVVPLAIAYASAISLWYLKMPKVAGVVSAAGRMALTTYLTQTILGITLFYGAFFGLGQQFGLTWLFIMVIGIYGVQVVLSRWWMRRFEFGPVEWVWRQMTYGKRLALVKGAREDAEPAVPAGKVAKV